jgi:hypothetical protein
MVLLRPKHFRGIVPPFLGLLPWKWRHYFQDFLSETGGTMFRVSLKIDALCAGLFWKSRRYVQASTLKIEAPCSGPLLCKWRHHVEATTLEIEALCSGLLWKSRRYVQDLSENRGAMFRASLKIEEHVQGFSENWGTCSGLLWKSSHCVWGFFENRGIMFRSSMKIESLCSGLLWISRRYVQGFSENRGAMFRSSMKIEALCSVLLWISRHSL